MDDGIVRLRRCAPDADAAVLVAVRCAGLVHDAGRLFVVHLDDDLVVLRVRARSPTTATGLVAEVERLLQATFVRGWCLDEAP